MIKKDIVKQARPPAVNHSHGIALIGCGDVAGTHLDAYTDADFDVRALCDIDVERAQDRRDEYVPDADVTDDYRKILARDDVDVIDATTQPGPRATIISEALEAKKHVLSQKPFTTDIETARQLVELATENDVRLAVNQNARWAPGVAYLRAAVNSGRLGTPHGVSVERTWDYSRIAGDQIAHRLLLHYAIHWLDLVRCVLPGNAESVYAATSTSPTQTPDQPVVTGIVVRFANGQATLRFDGDAPHDTVDRTRVIGDAGSIKVAGSNTENRTVRLTDEHGTIIPSLSGSWNPDGWCGAMAELLAAIEHGEQPPHSGNNNIQTLKLVFATIESARTGESIKPGEATALPSVEQ